MPAIPPMQRTEDAGTRNAGVMLARIGEGEGALSAANIFNEGTHKHTHTNAQTHEEDNQVGVN